MTTTAFPFFFLIVCNDGMIYGETGAKHTQSLDQREREREGERTWDRNQTLWWQLISLMGNKNKAKYTSHN